MKGACTKALIIVGMLILLVLPILSFKAKADESYCTITYGSDFDTTNCLNGTNDLLVHEKRYFTQGNWVPIDTTITITNVSNFAYEMTNAPYKAYFRNNTNTEGAITFLKDNYSFTYDLSGGKIQWRATEGHPDAVDTLGDGAPSNSQDDLAEINNEEKSVYYVGAFSNTTVKYYLQNNMLKENFILYGLPSLKDYIYLEYTGNIKFNASLDICTDEQCYKPSGTQDDFETSGRIYFREVVNETDFTNIFWIEAPTITDATGRTTTGSYSVHGSNAQMNFWLRINKTFLENATFPITIDPTLVINGTTATLGGNLVYDTVSIINGGILYVDSGIGYLNISTTSNFTIDSTSQISGTGAGYYGGTGQNCMYHQSKCGPTGSGTGYGGGACAQNGAGGAGYAGAGYGMGGSTYGTSNLLTIEEGSSGGGGGCDTQGNCFPYECSSYGGNGGNGGAFVTIKSKYIQIRGIIDVNGSTGGGCGGGGSGTWFAGAGGGGAGGGILLIGKYVNISGSKLLSTGQLGGASCSGDGNGGQGGGGRIKVFSASDGTFSNTSSITDVTGYSVGTVYYNSSLTYGQLGLSNPPTICNLKKPTTPVVYSPTATYQFNSTICDLDNATDLNITTFNWGTNAPFVVSTYTGINDTCREYYTTIGSQKVNVWNYTWTANDTVNVTTTSVSDSFTITKAMTLINIIDRLNSISNTGLIGFWRLENNLSVADYSGYGRNGTINIASGGSSNISTSWFDNLLYSKSITINATQTLTNVYTVNVTGLNTTQLIAQGKMLPNCQDLRVVYQNTTELDRIVSNCNSSSTSIEFRLVATIYSTVDTNYALFYGNSSAIGLPPTNKSNVYWLADDFNTLDTTNKWDTVGSVSVSNGILNITQVNTAGTFGDLISKEKDFAPPFSLEMGNTYWSVGGTNIVIRRQLNATGWTTDFRAGLYCDGNACGGANQWLWFSVNNAPALGGACSFDKTTSHNRTLVIWNTSLAQYYQDGVLTCTNSTTQQISTSTNWSVDLEVATATGAISQFTDWVIVRKLASASTTPVITLGSEALQNSWFDTSYLFRYPVTITEKSGNNLVNYSYNITVDTSSLISSGKLDSSCNCLAFTNSSNSLLNAYMPPVGFETGATGCNVTNSLIWVKISNQTASTNTTIYMYSSPSCSQNYVNSSDAMLSWDDFTGTNGTNASSSRWQTVDASTGGKCRIYSNQLNCTADSSGWNWARIKSNWNLSINSPIGIYFNGFMKVATSDYMDIALFSKEGTDPYNNNRTGIEIDLQQPTGNVVLYQEINSAGTTLSTQAATATAYHEYSAWANSTHFSFWVDGTKYNNTNAYSGQPYGYLVLSTSDNSGRTFWFDNITARYIVYPEPTSSIGNEQTQSYGTWWNKGWAGCENITFKDNIVSVNRQFNPNFVNLTGLTITKYSEIRIVNQPCNNGGNEIKYMNFPAFTDNSTWALVEFEVNKTAGVDQVYSVYYNNPYAQDPNYNYYVYYDNWNRTSPDKLSINGTQTNINKYLTIFGAAGMAGSSKISIYNGQQIYNSTVTTGVASAYTLGLLTPYNMSGGSLYGTRNFLSYNMSSTLVSSSNRYGGWHFTYTNQSENTYVNNTYVYYPLDSKEGYLYGSLIFQNSFRFDKFVNGTRSDVYDTGIKTTATMQNHSWIWQNSSGGFQLIKNGTVVGSYIDATLLNKVQTIPNMTVALWGGGQDSSVTITYIGPYCAVSEYNRACNVYDTDLLYSMGSSSSQPQIWSMRQQVNVTNNLPANSRNGASITFNISKTYTKPDCTDIFMTTAGGSQFNQFNITNTIGNCTVQLYDNWSASGTNSYWVYYNNSNVVTPPYSQSKAEITWTWNGVDTTQLSYKSPEGGGCGGTHYFNITTCPTVGGNCVQWYDTDGEGWFNVTNVTYNQTAYGTLYDLYVAGNIAESLTGTILLANAVRINSPLLNNAGQAGSQFMYWTNYYNNIHQLQNNTALFVSSTGVAPSITANLFYSIETSSKTTPTGVFLESWVGNSSFSDYLSYNLTNSPIYNYTGVAWSTYKTGSFCGILYYKDMKAGITGTDRNFTTILGSSQSTQTNGSAGTANQINGMIGYGLSLSNSDVSFNTIPVDYLPFTISLWIKSPNGNWTSSGKNFIINQPFSFAISSETTGLKAYWYNTTHNFSGSLVLPTNDTDWHSLIINFAPSGSSIGNFIEYVDGTKYTIPANTITPITGSLTNLFIGDSTNTFTGSYDEVMFWNRSLTDAEAQFLSRFTGSQLSNYTYTCAGSCLGLYFGNTTNGTLTESLIGAGYDNRNLGMGNFYYYVNSTDNENYTADAFSVGFQSNKMSPNIYIFVTTPITYGTASDAHCSENNTGDSDLTYNCYRDNNFLGAGSDVYDTTSLGAGNYTYIYNTTGGVNYSSNSVSQILTINKAPTTATLYLNGSTTNQTSVYPVVINITATSSISGLYVQIWQNTTLVANTTNIATYTSTPVVSYYNYTTQVLNNANYSDSTPVSLFWNITKASRTCTLATDKNWTRIYDATPSSTSCSVSDGSLDGTMVFTMNSTPVSTPDAETTASIYNYACQWVGGVNYSDCAQQTNTLTINKASTSTSLTFDNPSPINYTTTTTASCSDTNPEASSNLYRDSLLANTENNVAIKLGVLNHSYVCNVSETTNYLNSSNSSSYIVNQISPVLNITFNSSVNYVQENTTVVVNCSYLENVPVTLYKNYLNNISNVSNPYTYNTAGYLNNTYFTCNTTGNQNFTVENTSNTLFVYPYGGLVLNVYDEANPTTLIPFNLTASNSTYSINVVNPSNPFKNNTVFGLVTLDLSAGGFYQRTYYASLSSTSYTVVNAYLTATTTGQYVNFYILDPTENPISGATVDAYRFINNVWTLVAEKTSDDSGTTTFFLDYTKQYQINVTKYNYNPFSTTITPTQTSYKIHLTGQAGSYTNYTETPYTSGAQGSTGNGTGIATWSILPNGASLSQTVYTFSFTVTAPSSNLAYFGARILYCPNNCTQVYINNITTTTGGTVSQPFNLSGATGNVIQEVWYKVGSFAEWRYNKTYFIWGTASTLPNGTTNASDLKVTSISGAVEMMKSDPNYRLDTCSSDPNIPCGFAFGIVTILLSMIVMGFAKTRTSWIGSGLAGIVIMGMFNAIGNYIYGAQYWFGWGLFALMGVVVVAIAYLMRGGG